jgi:hypothetical protein
MPQWVYYVGVIVAYVALIRWVLPAMGVPT